MCSYSSMVSWRFIVCSGSDRTFRFGVRAGVLWFHDLRSRCLGTDKPLTSRFSEGVEVDCVDFLVFSEP